MKKNSSLLYAILGGVITCFICVGMVFLFPSKGNKNLSGSEKALPEQSSVGQNYEDEISLGDSTGKCVKASTYASANCTVTCSNYSGQSSCNNTYGCCTWEASSATPTPTAVTCSVYSMQTGDRCAQQAQDDCAPYGYTGCNTKGSNGCYSYTCKSAPTATPTATPTAKPTTYSCYDKNDSCYLKTGLTSACNGTRYFTSQSACYQALGSTTPTPTATSSSYNCSQHTDVTSCNTGQAASYCSYCNGGCKTKSQCSTSSTPTPTATANTTVCCYTHGSYSSMPSAACTASGGSQAAASHCSSSTPTPTATPNNNCLAGCNSTCLGGTGNTAAYCTNYCNIQCGVTTPTPSPKPTATPTSDVTMCCCNSQETTCYTMSECTGTMHVGNPKLCNPNATPSPTPKACTTPYTYWNGVECISCPAGYTASVAVPKCHMSVPAGSYLVGGTTQIIACPANTYSTGGIYYLSGGNSSLLTCQSCPADTTSPIGSTSKSACVAKTGECKVSVSTSASRVSPNTAQCPNVNGYADTFTVTVSISGDGCNKGTLTMSASGAQKQGGTDSHTVSNGQTFNFLYKPTTCCSTASVTATVSYKDASGKAKTASGSTSVSTEPGWVKVESNKCTTASAYNSNNHSYAEADNKGQNEYWIALDNQTCGEGSRKVDIYKRYKCGGGTYTQPTPTPVPSTPKPGTTPTPAPTATPIVVPYCYIDDDGGYKWTNSPKASWKKVDGVTKPEDCKAEEKPACYEDPNGKYVWGNHAKSDGYKLIDSIKDEATCKKPENCACYKNTTGEYLWATEKPKECFEQDKCWIAKTNPIDPSTTTCPYDTQEKCETAMGYVKVDSIKTAAECTAPENPACYVHGNEFVWGKYAKLTGYIKLDDITKEEDCKLPENDACYEDIDGNYVWGKYGDDPNYTIVPSVTELSQCVKDVPVPPTASNVSRLVYVFMAILMACGIGFIYYSSVIKKSNQ